MVTLREGLWSVWIVLKEFGRLPEHKDTAERLYRALRRNGQNPPSVPRSRVSRKPAGRETGRMALAGLEG